MYCGESNHRSVHCYDPHIGCENGSCNVADTHRSYQPKYHCRASTTWNSAALAVAAFLGDQKMQQQARLFPDMQPLSAQIQRCSDNAKGAITRLTGATTPSLPDTETTFDELKERVAKTVALLQARKDQVGRIELPGVDHVIEAVAPLDRVASEKGNAAGVEPISRYPEFLLRTLQSVAPQRCNGDPTVAVLTVCAAAVFAVGAAFLLNVG